MFFGDALGRRVDDALARVDQQDFADHQFALGAEFDPAFDLAFERGRGFADPRMLHHRRRHRRQAGFGELAFSFRYFVAGDVHRIGRRFVGQVDHVLAGAPDILEGVLDCAVGAPVEAQDAQRRVLRDRVEEGERRAVGDAVFVPGGHPADRARDHEADDQLVALQRRQARKLELHQSLAGVTSAPTRSTIIR